MAADKAGAKAEIKGSSRERKLSAASLSIGVNLGLLAVEGIVAAFTGSLGVLADAGHSGFDMGASLFAYWGIRMASAPPDARHNYGYEKYENFATLVQMAMLIGIAAFVGAEVAFRLTRGFDLDIGPVPIVVIVVTLAVDLLTTRYLARVALEEGSSALEADSYHFLTDMWTKVAVLIGLSAAAFGQVWLDPAAALAVACFMLYAAFRLGRGSAGVLLDAAPGAEVMGRIRGIVIDEAGAEGYHSLRMRQAGKSVYLDLSLHVEPDMTIAEAHERAHRLSRRLQGEVREVREAVVHVEPADGHDHLDGDHS